MAVKFTGSNGTDLTAYPWSDPADVRPSTNQFLDLESSAAITVETNKAQAAVASPTWKSRFIDCGGVPGTITVDLDFPGPAPNVLAYFGFVIRGNNLASNYFVCGISFANPNYRLHIGKWNGTSFVDTVQSIGATDPFAAGPRTLVIEDSGTVITAYFQDTPGTTVSVTDADYYTNQFVGPAVDSNNQSVTWDNAEVNE
jgi:hypothetical protein